MRRINKMTEQKFRKRVKIRIFMAILLMLTGIGLVAYTVIKQGGFIPDDAYFNQSLSHGDFFGQGYYYGVSLGITFAALATAIKNILWLRDKEKFNKQYIRETDERNREIGQKAMSISWFFTLYVLLVATFFVPVEALSLLLCIMAVSVSSYALSYAIFQKKM
jgi:hypothetical protein